VRPYTLSKKFLTSLSRYVVILFNFQLSLFKDQRPLSGERVHSIAKPPSLAQGGFLKNIHFPVLRIFNIATAPPTPLITTLSVSTLR
jgi:hypothetical protein